MTKKLFVFADDCGDGSFYPKYTFNEEWVDEMQKKYDSGDWEYPMIGVDGDGFHYNILTVPDECTLASLGIPYDLSEMGV